MWPELRTKWFSALVLSSLLAGCISLDKTKHYACDADGGCPDSLVCREPQHLCLEPDAGAGADAGPGDGGHDGGGMDGGHDGGVVDEPCDGGVLFSPAQQRCQASGCWENPIAGSLDLAVIRGSGPTNLWAAGAQGLLLHYDGQQWTAVDAGTAQALTALWAGPDGTVWYAGAQGTLSRLNCRGSTSFQLGSTPDLYALAGAAGGPVFAVGQGGAVYAYRAGAWSRETISQLPSNTDFHGVWEAANGEVWTVGTGGTTYHYDGTQWTGNLLAQGSNTYWSVEGSGTSPWAVGDKGTIKHWTGASWQDFPAPDGGTAVTLRDVWVPPSGAPWLVGNTPGRLFTLSQSGTLGALDVPSGADAGLQSVWGALVNPDGGATPSPSDVPDVWAVGAHGLIVHGRAAGLSEAPGGFVDALYGMAENSVDKRLWVVGDGLTAQRSGTGLWSPVPGSPPRRIYGVGYDQTNNAMMAVGEGEGVYHYVNGSWTKDSLPSCSTLSNFYAFTRDPVYLNTFIAGDKCVLQYTPGFGGGWTAGSFNAAFRGAWADSASDTVVLVGLQGTVYNVTPPSGLSPWTYQQVTVDGANLPDGGVADLYGVWSGSDGVIWIVGSSGTIILYTVSGSSTRIDTGLNVTLRAVAGSAPNDVWAVGDNGTVLHWTGGGWSPVDLGVRNEDFSAVAVTKSGVWIAGSNGTILRYSP